MRAYMDVFTACLGKCYRAEICVVGTEKCPNSSFAVSNAITLLLITDCQAPSNWAQFHPVEVFRIEKNAVDW